jgi:hypothetical protein
MIGKGFPQNASATLCIFQFRESMLNSTVTVCNATVIVCNVPSWGLRFAAQTVLVYFVSEDFAAPAPNMMAVDFVSSVSSLRPSIQSLYGGTLVFVEGLGFDGNAPEFNCVFLQGTIRLMTSFSVRNPGIGTCPTPFWNAANSANRTYEVKLIFGLDATELNAGIIELA